MCHARKDGALVRTVPIESEFVALNTPLTCLKPSATEVWAHNLRKSGGCILLAASDGPCVLESQGFLA